MSTSPEDVERLEQIEDAETANLEVEEKAEVEEADGSIPEADEHRELEADGEKVRATTPKTNVLETDGHVVTTEANSSEDDEFQFDLSTAGVPIPGM